MSSATPPTLLSRNASLRGRAFALGALFFAAVLGHAGEGMALADGASRTADLPLFSISKSENKNQVQYVVRVDERCQPVTDAPISAYWKMLELGPTRTEPILSRELRAYGLASQTVLARAPESSKVRLVLRAVPSRPIVVDVVRAPNGECRALATVTIAGAPAHLFDVFAKIRELFGVDYLLIRGWSLDGSHVLTERLKG